MRSYILCISAIILSNCISEKPDQNKIDIKSSTETLIVTDSTIKVQPQKKNKPSTLVLPPFDEIHNKGISPDILAYLEDAIGNDTSVSLIKFPLKKLMGTPYQNVFDKKYCQPILEVVDAEIVVMSKLDHLLSSGKMSGDTWNLRLRIYNTDADLQFDSKIKADELTDAELQKLLSEKQADLIEEIKNTFRNL
jgi:hypothetical protein